jgi:dUTP pyrophosphatase
MPIVKIKLLDDDLSMPDYAHKGDAGLDLQSRIDYIIDPLERALIPTGLKIEIPDGYAGFIQPRSGLAINKGIGVLNSPGLIDSGYRGEINVILINLDRHNPFVIKKCDKICQMIIQKVENVKIQIVKNLKTTERGSGGFGSTGISKP